MVYRGALRLMPYPQEPSALASIDSFNSITNLAPQCRWSPNTLCTVIHMQLQSVWSKCMLHALFSCICLTIPQGVDSTYVRDKVGDAVQGVAPELIRGVIRGVICQMVTNGVTCQKVTNGLTCRKVMLNLRLHYKQHRQTSTGLCLRSEQASSVPEKQRIASRTSQILSPASKQQRQK